MKKFITLALILISISVSARETFTYKDVGGTIGWYDANDAPGRAPGVRNFDDFIIEADGYEVPVGAEYLCVNFTVKGDKSFILNGKLKVLNKFSVEAGGNSAVGVHIGANGHLLLTGTAAPEVGASIDYTAATSKVSLGLPPDEESFRKIDPYFSNKGILIFDRDGQEYKCDLHIKSDITYSISAEGIIIDGSLITDADFDIGGSSEDLIITGSVTIAENVKLTVSSDNVEFEGLVKINKGSTLYFKDENSDFKVGSLDIDADLNGQGLVCGIITCNNVTTKVAVISSSDAYNGGSSTYREIGIPFSKTVADINWGEYDSEIKASNSKHRHSFDNSTARFTNSEPTDNVMGPQEVWLKGGSDIIKVIGASLDDMHNIGYTETLSNVADVNGTLGYNMLINPSLAAYDIRQLVGDNLSKIKGAAWLMTKKSDGSYGYVEFIGELDPKRTISPFQAFWVEYNNTGGDIFLDPKNQKTTLDISLQKKGANTSKLKNNIRLELLSDDGNNAFLDNIRLFYSDDISVSNGAYNAKNIRAGIADGGPSIYMNDNSERLIYKEFNTSDINSGNFVQSFSMVGGNDMNYKIQLTNNDLGDGSNVYLTDKKTGLTVKLNDGPYSFSHTATSTFPTSDRFDVKITTEALGESERIEAANIKLINRSNSVEFVMPSTSAIESVQFVNLNGQVMKIVKANSGQTEFDVAELNNGVFIAQLKLESGNVASFKFVR